MVLTEYKCCSEEAGIMGLFNCNKLKKLVNVNTMDNYQLVDIMKYVAAFMVICIHTNQLFPQLELNFFIKQIVCRIAVPFFFISSAFFVRQSKDKNTKYVKGYLINLTKSYLLWSIVFIPIGLDWIYQNLEISGQLLPFALIYGLIHIGTYYHLWYIPALLFSIFCVDRLLKHISYKKLFVIAFFLYLFGSLESYYGILQSGGFKEFFDILIKVIFTTRSGLFFGMIYTLIGFYIYDYRNVLQSILKYIPVVTILSMILLIIEGSFLYTIKRLDMNFLIMLVPFSFFLFIWILSFPYKPQIDTKNIRELSKNYYFIHPVCIVIVEAIGLAYDVDFLTAGVISLLCIVLLTHILSRMIISFKRPIIYSYILLASILGIIVTGVLAGVFYQFKIQDIMVKFEFVPCLWFYSSFTLYYIFCRRGKKYKKNFSLSNN